MQKLENDQQANGMTYEYVDKKNNIYNNLNQGTNIKKEHDVRVRLTMKFCNVGKKRINKRLLIEIVFCFQAFH